MKREVRQNLTIEQVAAGLEADQADRDFMRHWLREGGTLADSEYLRAYRSAAEHLYFRTIRTWNYGEGDHLDSGPGSSVLRGTQV